MKHIRPLPVLNIVERSDLLAKLQKRSVVERRSYRVTDECWIYQGKWEDGKGFKKIKVKGRGYYVHRIGRYAMLGEDIPTGLVLDHQCRVRGCWRPSHTEPVTTRVNTERGNGGWVYGQGCCNGLPNHALIEAAIEHGDPRFVMRDEVNKNDPALGVAGPTEPTSRPFVVVDESDPRTSLLSYCQKNWDRITVGESWKQAAPPSFCERHKLEGWLPRNVARVWRWLRGRA